MDLASIAKAIEYKRPCQIFIEGFEKKLFKECQRFTANVEPFMAFKLKDSKEFIFVQHFIFYERDEDKRIERFHIAHELGHCALHSLLEDRVNRRVWGELSEIGRCYIVDCTDEEEKEADAFACFLDIYRPKPIRDESVNVNENVHRVIEEFNKKGILSLPKE